MEESNTNIGRETPPSSVKVKDSTATAGMWCSIVALITVFIPFVQFISPILAILAIVFLALVIIDQDSSLMDVPLDK